MRQYFVALWRSLAKARDIKEGENLGQNLDSFLIWTTRYQKIFCYKNFKTIYEQDHFINFNIHSSVIDGIYEFHPVFFKLDHSETAAVKGAFWISDKVLFFSFCEWIDELTREAARLDGSFLSSSEPWMWNSDKESLNPGAKPDNEATSWTYPL